jgi:predicted RNase H-like nuclease (RuvC/YqgF family)
MKAIPYVVAILILGGAAYFTLEHSRKFTELEDVRLKTIADNKAVSANADAKETELRKANEVLASTKQTREVRTQELDSLKNTAGRLQGELAELDRTLTAQEEQFAQLNKTMEEVGGMLKDLGDDITLENLADKIQELEEDRKAKQEKLEELETLVSSGEKALETKRSEVDRLVRREVQRTARITRNSMEAVVTAVNQDWGFLVIGAGSNSGFAPQTSMLVMRDGRMIARITPSAIEPTQTIAEIDFKSMAPGARIQPGDRVILTKPTAN